MGSKYIIDGIPLDAYCKKHNLNFRTQLNRVRDYIKKHPELTEKDAIKLAISRCGVHPGTKFMYGSISLAEWCRQNDKAYDCMISRVESIKTSFPDIDDNEATRIAIEDYSDKGIKYFYDGIPLVEYCKLHPEYLYSSISLYIRRKKEGNPNLTNQEIIVSYFKTSHTPHTYHFIDDLPLMEYCDKHGIVYASIMTALSKMRKMDKYKSLSEQERLNIALANYKRPYLFWGEKSLFSYCKENNYSYNSVYNYVIQMIKNNPDISYEEAIKSAFVNIKRYGIKYYHKGIPLVQYCKENKLREASVRDRILYLLQSQNMTLEKAIEESVSYYERKKRLNDINKIFDYLKNTKNINKETLKEILLYLKIDVQNVLFLIDRFSNVLDSIYFIWYFYDSNSEDLLSVSENKIKEIFLSVRSLSSLSIIKEKILKMDLGYLIGVYKANLFDTRYLILLHQEKLHYHILLELMSYYGLNLSDEDKKDIINDANLFLLELIEKNNNNNIAMVISYLNKSIKGFILNRILDLVKQQGNISLYSPVYKNGNSKNEKLLIDKISDKQNDNMFSDKIQEIICSLDSTSQSFIYYKFYECLSNEEISGILNIDLDELNVFEKCILGRLSENESLKKLVKK